ncbi:DUF3817 domain-containing protein [Flammeovirga sp. SJP92]|uniref:DUF3817 domain-containing protein n=1 Tax=Flammeovirga sp. SJP92 TaxID=1775430 RepID=UPI00078995B6|nr:DUF3817 domain-containing protein [Flammeovirga sp. SJP92]KXX70818.1 hypothetical protein AVL50_11585 [Flammeovirga sp. SJP92]
MSGIKAIRFVGLLEGISYLLILFVSMPLKYYAGMSEPNKIIGMGHGILFILYIVIVLYIHFTIKWGIKNSIWAFIASLIPFGTFVADKKIFKGFDN